MDEYTTRELIKSANQIREKYRALKRGKYMGDEMRMEQWKPIVEPLQKLTTLTQPPPQTLVAAPPPAPPPVLRTPSRIPALQTVRAPSTLEFGLIASKYLGNYFTRRANTDSTYGIRTEDDKFHIGSKRVEIANDDLTIGDRHFHGTEGLWQLLTLKDPKQYTDEDLNTYKEILEQTNAHRKNYKEDAPLSSNKHTKYKNIIKPLFTAAAASVTTHSDTPSTSNAGDTVVTGEGYKEVSGKRIDYRYWNDVNELVDHLRLLIMSQEAGNTGLHNEIESILEELKEENIIVI